MKSSAVRLGIGLGLLLSLLLAGAPLAHAQGYIYNQMQVPGSAMAVADLNRDGIPDIVTIVNAGSFSVCLGKRDGTFAAPVIVDAAYAPSALVVGDFNGDGKPDIAATSIFSNPPVRVYLGNGDGTFQAPVTYSAGAGPVGIVTADFNGDHKLDLAVLNQADSTVSVYFGNGDGTFQSQAVQSVTASASVLLTADLNNDGRADIVAIYSGHPAMSVLLAAADGTFSRSDTTLPQNTANAGALGDFNGDGIPDLVVPLLNFDPTHFALMFGNGDGTFQAPVLVPIPYSYNASAVVVGDFNRDGKLDVAILGSALLGPSQVAVVLGHGDGTFTAGTTSVAVYGSPLLFADFNGDGVPDLLTGSTIELGAGDGTFANPVTIAGMPQVAGPAVSGDFNGDGKLDVAFPAVIGPNNYQMVTLLGNGNGTFQNPILSPPTGSALGNGSPPGLTADLNGDGKLDVVFVSPYQVAAALGNGDGTFQGVTTTLLPTGLYFQSAATGDFNHDGKTDLAVMASDPQFHEVLQILLSNGDGTFTAGSQYSLGYALVAGITSADLNGDGNIDLAVSLKYENAVNILLGNGDGTFRLGTAVTSTSYPLGVSAGDINKDGIPDLVVVSLNSDQTCGLSVLYGNGNGTFQAPIVTTFGSYGNCPNSRIKIGDLNGDGNLDLITSVPLSTFLGYGDGTFSSEVFFNIGASFSSALVGDFNGDGTTDLGALSSNENTLSFLFSSPAFGAYPSRLSFPQTDVNSLSPPQALNLVNLGAIPMSISSITANGEYSQTNNCGDSLPAQASCEVNAVFSPTNTGPNPGSITIVDNAVPGPQILSLAGVGVVPVAGASPGTVPFSQQLVGTPSTAQVVTLNNTGSGPLFLAGISFAGSNGADFAESDNCGSALAAGANCAISVTFAPTAVGARSATLTITDNNNGVAGSTQTVSLSGTGIAPIVSLAPASLPAFADQHVGTAGAAQTITLNNTGTAPLTLTSVAITGTNSGDFAETSTCGTAVAIAGSCTINVTFTPTAIGARTATLTFTDNNYGVPNSTQTFSLSGTGTGAVVALAPNAVAFAGQAVGASSPASSITLTNNGNAPLTITAIAVTGSAAPDFAIQSASTCNSTVAITAGASCTIILAFTPSAPGARSASLSILDNGVNGSPQSVALSGTGTAPAVSLSATSLTFPSQLAGTSSPAQTITLTNTGTASLTFMAITFLRSFYPVASGTTCSVDRPVPPGSSCTVAVIFTPDKWGLIPGFLSFADNASDSAQEVTLTGTGLDFTFAPPSGSATTATAAPGQSATYTLRVGGQGGMNQAITFTCTGAPSEATCTVSPNPVTPGSSATNVTITVTTTAPSVNAPRSRPFPTVPPLSPGLRVLLAIALALVVMAWAIARRNRHGVTRWQTAIVPLAAGLLLALALAGCGGGGGGGGGGTTHDPGTPAGTYSLTVTGTAGSGSSALIHTVTLTLNVS